MKRQRQCSVGASRRLRWPSRRTMACRSSTRWRRSRRGVQGRDRGSVLGIQCLENRTALSAAPLAVTKAAAVDFAPRSITVAGSVAYFAATDAAHGEELWRTDGTAAGTKLVKDIRP